MSIQTPPSQGQKVKDPEKIRQMFSQVAPNYDRANSVLSGGIHHLWRKKLVKLSGAHAGQAVLDCATGTGDLALEFKKAVGPTGRVVGTDFCAEMLASAPAKSAQMNLPVEWAQADAMNLQFKDREFDFTSISFGIRNVADPVKALKEMARVTKPGGSVFVLEFGQVEIPGFSQIYNFYSQKVLPVIGGMVTGQRQAYKYLQESSAEFPCRKDFVKMMEQTGNLTDCRYWSLTGGIAYIYKGVVK